MFKPEDILSVINEKTAGVQIQYGTTKGLGNGGFFFKYNSYNVKHRDYYLSIIVDGEYVNPIGPFKKKVVCSIEMKVEPYDFDANPHSKGSYGYKCFHCETFWGKYYTEDAGKLFERLLDDMVRHFRECDTSGSIYKDENNFTRFQHYLYEYNKYFVPTIIKYF